MTREQDVAEIRSVVYQMAERFGAKDVEGVMALWIKEGASLVGTGADEVRFGSDAVRLQIARDVSEVDTFSFGMENLRVDVVGDAAFAFADVEISATFGSESMRFPVRATYSLDAYAALVPESVRRAWAGVDMGGLGPGIWDEVVDAVTARYPSVTLGKMFGMPCLKRADGRVIAVLWKDGGIAVKLVDDTARAEALALPGADVATHAFDPSRQMRNWVHVPTQTGGWELLVERALGSLG